MIHKMHVPQVKTMKGVVTTQFIGSLLSIPKFEAKYSAFEDFILCKNNLIPIHNWLC